LKDFHHRIHRHQFTNSLNLFKFNPIKPDIFGNDFRVGVLALGIMTPPAMQRASLEENRGADAWSVVNGKLLYVEYNSFHQMKMQMLLLKMEEKLINGKQAGSE